MDDLTPEERAARVLRDRQSVRDMVDNHHGFQVLFDLVHKRQDQVLKEIVRGELCHDDYRSYTGELKGLRRIDVEVERLLGQAQEGPEDV